MRAGTIKSPVLREATTRELPCRCLCKVLITDSSSTSIPTRAQPAILAVASSGIYVATPSGLEVHPYHGSASTYPGATSAVAAHGDIIAFGSGARKVVLASTAGGSVRSEAEFEDNRGEVLALAFSPDGGLLASGDVRESSVLALTLGDWPDSFD